MAIRAAAILAELHVPKGKCICHRCDNPACVNPDHFFVGTQADNLADMRAKGRGVLPPGCKWGAIKFPKAIIDRVRALRAAGGSQYAIGAIVGMSQSNVSRILAGVTRSFQ